LRNSTCASGNEECFNAAATSRTRDTAREREERGGAGGRDSMRKRENAREIEIPTSELAAQLSISNDDRADFSEILSQERKKH